MCLRGAAADSPRKRAVAASRARSPVNPRPPSPLLASRKTARRWDFIEMVRWLRAAGVRTALVLYPVDLNEFASVNRAVRRVAREEGVPFVDSPSILQRLTPEQRKLRSGAHPNARMYREIARDMAKIVRAPEP